MRQGSHRGAAVPHTPAARESGGCGALEEWSWAPLPPPCRPPARSHAARGTARAPGAPDRRAACPRLSSHLRMGSRQARDQRLASLRIISPYGCVWGTRGAVSQRDSAKEGRYLKPTFNAASLPPPPRLRALAGPYRSPGCLNRWAFQAEEQGGQPLERRCGMPASPPSHRAGGCKLGVMGWHGLALGGSPRARPPCACLSRMVGDVQPGGAGGAATLGRHWASPIVRAGPLALAPRCTRRRDHVDRHWTQCQVVAGPTSLVELRTSAHGGCHAGLLAGGHAGQRPPGGVRQPPAAAGSWHAPRGCLWLRGGIAWAGQGRSPGIAGEPRARRTSERSKETLKGCGRNRTKRDGSEAAIGGRMDEGCMVPVILSGMEHGSWQRISPAASLEASSALCERRWPAA